MPTNHDDLAGGATTIGTFAPVELFCGDDAVHTGSMVIASGLTFAKYEVLARNAAGEAIKFNPAGSAPDNVAHAIAAQPTTVAGNVPVFLSGAFNNAALVWPASGMGTYALRQSAFLGKPIRIGKVVN